jgi:hypothetical protein
MRSRARRLRAWLEILGARHPGVTWMPASEGLLEDEETTRSAPPLVEVMPVVVE